MASNGLVAKLDASFSISCVCSNFSGSRARSRLSSSNVSCTFSFMVTVWAAAAGYSASGASLALNARYTGRDAAIPGEIKYQGGGGEYAAAAMEVGYPGTHEAETRVRFA